MKKHLVVFFVAFVWFLRIPSFVFAEEISRFVSDIQILPTGRIHVAESILYDFGELERHGIFRSIPLTKKNTEGKEFRLSLLNPRVHDGRGQTIPFTSTDRSGIVTYRIGNANITVTGQKEYVIDYDVAGALTYFSDHDELYWNINGNDWTVPISTVEATITLPQNVQESDISVSCFTGARGSSDENCTTHVENNVITVAGKNFEIGEGVSLVVGFPKGLVAVLEPKEIIDYSQNPWIQLLGKCIVIGLLIAAFFWYLIYPIWLPIRWWRFGRDPKPRIGSATAWFSAPKDGKGREITPAEVGSLVDERVDTDDITAIVVDLARRGYLVIVETKKDEFTLEKKQADETILLPFEQKLYDGIFGKKPSVRVSSLNLYETSEEVKRLLYEQHITNGFFPENPNKIRRFYAVIGILAFTTGNLALLLVTIIFGRAMPRKTLEGSQAAAIARALRKFLVSQEKQLAFQAKTQMMFEKLLPYAIAFGVERIWAARFSTINLKQPEWYKSTRMDSSMHFSSSIFVGSLNQSLSSVRYVPTSTRSTSGFSSGFSSGGGFSGGGGGGGGGGSW